MRPQDWVQAFHAADKRLPPIARRSSLNSELLAHKIAFLLTFEEVQSVITGPCDDIRGIARMALHLQRYGIRFYHE